MWRMREKERDGVELRNGSAHEICINLSVWSDLINPLKPIACGSMYVTCVFINALNRCERFGEAIP